MKSTIVTAATFAILAAAAGCTNKAEEDAQHSQAALKAVMSKPVKVQTVEEIEAEERAKEQAKNGGKK